MVPPCFEGAESISDLGLPQFQPLEGFCASVVFSISSDFLLAIHFFLVYQKKRVSQIVSCILPSSGHKRRRLAVLPDFFSGPALIDRFSFAQFSSSLSFSACRRGPSPVRVGASVA